MDKPEKDNNAMELQTTGEREGQKLPGWVPEAARRYLFHTERGVSIRALARSDACHPSTVLRQVRRFECLREDFLVDEILHRLGTALRQGAVGRSKHQVENPATNAGTKEPENMTYQNRSGEMTANEIALDREARRVLRRLCEKGAVLAVAAEMDKAVVVRETKDGQTTRTAVVDRAVAQAMALKDWITCAEPGRIARYRVTASGRAALSRIVAEEENAARGFAEAQSGFLPRQSRAGKPAGGARTVRAGMCAIIWGNRR
ncbi:hypothetical protein U5922_006670 [Aquicoccus sp. G2-2]|uniref:hypothetical protein n=1 Tax=Aquicoccus sp. G2-2 TaxID=3092120 RepID=UPI0036729AF7